MKISMICVGKLKETYLKEACQEYLKRLSRHCHIEVVEVADEKAPENLSSAQELTVKEKEADKILSKIQPASTVIVLDLAGKQLDSEQFSQKIQSLMVSGKSDITFVIGGSLGLSEALVKKADFNLCISNMTFPHQLVRVILLEQVFRAFKIMKGETYHK